jgi:hypothetical protein
MAQELEIGQPYLSPSSAQQFGSFVPEPIVETRWNKFLGELGHTEPEVLDAISRDCEVVHLIRRFVDDFSHNHFVPEDVLRVLNRHRKLQCEMEQLAAHLI